MSNDQSSHSDALTNHERTAIDASVAAPVLLFFGTSIFWLLFGSAFELISAIKLVWPCFLDGFALLTYGRTSLVSVNESASGLLSVFAVSNSPATRAL